MLKIRVISALIGIPILIGIAYAGEVYRIGLFLLMALVAMFEFLQMMKQAGRKAPVVPAYLLLLALLLAEISQQDLMPLILITLLLAVFQSVAEYPRITFENTSMALFFALYLGICLSYGIKLAPWDNAFEILLLTFLLTWASDVGGYAAGSRWGRHKLSPMLSPNKTWEGAIGGLLLSAAAAFIFFLVTDITELPATYALMVGLAASVGAQFGDLFVSGIKRYFGVKDSGNLIPGHGGVLDRFDSFLVVIPIIFLFFRNYS